MGRRGYDLSIDRMGVVQDEQAKKDEAKGKAEEKAEEAAIEKARKNKKKLPESAKDRPGRVFGAFPERELKTLAPKPEKDEKFEVSK